MVETDGYHGSPPFATFNPAGRFDPIRWCKINRVFNFFEKSRGRANAVE